MGSPVAERRVRDIINAASKGLISPSRLRFVPRIPGRRAFLSEYPASLDLALDPFPYCGTTTTCEALVMGVPVLTLADANDGRSTEELEHSLPSNVALRHSIPEWQGC